jgi:hypothetical protein
LLVPVGTCIAFTGGPDCNDHHRTLVALDKARAKHPTGCCCTAAARAAPRFTENGAG